MILGHIDQAAEMVARARELGYPTGRWLISIPMFDAARARLEARGELLTDILLPEPTLLGIPYDLGWPVDQAHLVLTATPVKLAPAPPRQ